MTDDDDLAAFFIHLTDSERQEAEGLLAGLTEDKNDRFSELQRRTPAVFQPLLAPARYKGAHGGRGGGKSHFMAELLVEMCYAHEGMRAVCLREVQESIRSSVKLLIQDKIISLGLRKYFQVWQDRIETPGGGLIIFQGMQDHTAESIKSLEGFRIAWFEEAQTCTTRSLELLRPTIRAPGSELWFSWNPRSASDPVDALLRAPVKPTGSVVVECNYEDNPWFPAELEQERAFDEQANPQRYQHIWRGGYQPQAVGAIWTRDNINQNRVSERPAGLTRIVVAVDPNVKSTKGADETGIIGAGITAGGNDAHGYVLADWSCRGKPEEWARRTVALFDFLDADCVVIETNQGGEMCKSTLQAVRRSLPIKMVTATKGKHVRAEPISALYSVNQISHIGAFPELERQLCLFTAQGYEGEGSPDRADALVWALTELFPKLVRKRSNVIDIHTVVRSRETQKRFCAR